MPVGRPRKFQTVEELQEAIDNYFESCFEDMEYKDDFGQRQIRRVQIRPFTVTGLAISVGLDRQGLIDYQAKEEYSDAIKNAKLKCENFAEESLFTNKNVTGVIFNLKNNYGWKDKTEVETSGETTVNNNLNLSNVSTDDLRKLLNE